MNRFKSLNGILFIGISAMMFTGFKTFKQNSSIIKDQQNIIKDQYNIINDQKSTIIDQKDMIKSLVNLNIGKYSNCPLNTWKILSEYPELQTKSLERLQTKNNIPPFNFLEAVVTSSFTTFDESFEHIVNHYNDSFVRNVYFTSLFYLLRDIHDQHNKPYKSKHIDWSGKFQDTRNATRRLYQYSEKLNDSWIHGLHVKKEYQRIQDVQQDIIV